MSIPSISSPPAWPSITDPTNFDVEAEDFVQWWEDNFQVELEATITAMNALGGTLTTLAAGGAFAMPYTVSSTTTDSDPGPGFMRLDNFAAQTSAGTLRLDLLSVDAVDRTNELTYATASTSSTKGRIRIQKVGDPTKYLSADYTAMATPAGYRNITLANVLGSSATPFANLDSVVIFWTPNGMKGDVGSTGLTYDPQTTNVQLVAADFAAATRLERVITANGITQTIAALSGIANGDWVAFRNATDSIQVLDPNGAETINGATTQKVYPGESCLIVKHATGFVTHGLAAKGSWVDIRRQNMSGVAVVDNTFTNTDFDEFELEGIGIGITTDGGDVWVRTSTDGGSTYDSGAATYDSAHVGHRSGAASAAVGGAADTKIVLNGNNGIGNAANETFGFRLNFFKPSAAAFLWMEWKSWGMNINTLPMVVNGSGTRSTAADVDAVRVMTGNANNFTAGELILRGRKK